MGERSNEENAALLTRSVGDVASALHRIADSFATLVDRAEKKPEDIMKQATEMIESIFSQTGLGKLLNQSTERPEPIIKAARIVKGDSDAA